MAALGPIVSVLAGLVTATGVAGVLLWKSPANLQAPEILDVGPVWPMVRQERVLRVRNPHLLRPGVIESITSTCGCVSPSGGALSVPARSDAGVTLIVAPQRFDRSVQAQVWVHQAGGLVHRVVVSGRVGVPFAGWPDRAALSRGEAGELELRMEPGFMEHVLDARVEPGPSGAGVRVVMDGAGSRLVFVPGPGSGGPALDSTVELVLTLAGAEPVVWSGWIIDQAQLQARPAAGEVSASAGASREGDKP